MNHLNRCEGLALSDLDSAESARLRFLGEGLASALPIAAILFAYLVRLAGVSARYDCCEQPPFTLRAPSLIIP